MLHGVAFAQVLYEPGDIHRTGGFGTHQFSSVNWGMLTARRAAGKGRLGLRAMGSLEPWTVSDCGYLNFLATGEVCEGDTIHDRQHPHDLIMELAADYDRPLRRSMRLQVYGGLAGEPALGPPGFPHRLSAMSNPIAPIGHHWFDATHVTYGVITAALQDRRWKAELSLFNGREPDANRADLDLGPLDSVAGRLTWLPTEHLAVQFSAGHLHHAEAEVGTRLRTSVNRATASATLHRQAGRDTTWATTFAYGVNSGPELLPNGILNATTHAGFVETSATVHDRHTLFGRAEVVQKPAHDLHIHAFPDDVFTVAKIQTGYALSFRSVRGVVPGLGGSFSMSLVPSRLEPRYTGRFARGAGVFLTLRPARHHMPSLRPSS